MKFDWTLFALALLLSSLGILLIYSSVHGTELEQLWVRQLAFLFVAIGVMIFFSRIPVRIHDGMAYVYYAVMILLLLIALLQPGSVKRWLSIGPISVQPSEFSKLVMVFVLGRFLRDYLRSVGTPVTIALAILLVIPPFLLVIRGPDLGTAIVFFVLLFVMLYASGIRPLHLFLLLVPLFAMVSAIHWIAWLVFFGILLLVLLRWRVTPATFISAIAISIAIGLTTPYVWSNLHSYQRERIMVFLNPGHDPFGAGYQLIQSKIAFGSGGIFGKGFMQGTQTRLAFLPAKHSDFVFAVLGEQFGFVGCFLVLILYFFLLWRIIKISSEARTPFGSMVTFGFAGIIFFQVFLNMAMAVGLAPITGIPLPFLSSGGSSLVVFWAMIGTTQYIYSQRLE